MGDDARTKPPVWPLPIACAVAFLVGQGVGLVYLAGLALIRGGLPREPNEFAGRFQEALFSPVGLLGTVMISATVFAASALLGARLDREPLRERLRLGATPIPAAHLALAALGMVAVGLILDGLLALGGWSDAGMLGHMADAVAALSGPGRALAVLVIGGMAGTAEELFFRGFVQTRLRQRYGPAWAIGLTAVVFGGFHCDLWHSPTAAVMGVYLGWLAERTAGLRAPIAAHVVNNALYVPMVVWGPKELSVATELVLMAVGVAITAVVVVLLARAYPPAAARLELEAANPSPAPLPPASLE